MPVGKALRTEHDLLVVHSSQRATPTGAEQLQGRLLGWSHRRRFDLCPVDPYESLRTTRGSDRVHEGRVCIGASPLVHARHANIVQRHDGLYVVAAFAIEANEALEDGFRAAK